MNLVADTFVKVVDRFCPHADRVRRSALSAGFDTWLPNKGKVGSSVYEGMGFWGEHASMLASLSQAMESVVFPNSMFFRITQPGMQEAYIHSDRETGAYTCVAYLSQHANEYGTAFYRHKATGLTEMPPLDELDASMIEDITHNRDAWEVTRKVMGRFNRAVIFSAPLFHSRLPLDGLGDDNETARMVWVSHFHTPASLMEAEYG
jgi:Family of unknown function (DUF6445)